MAAILPWLRRDYLRTLQELLTTRLQGADISIFHKFYRPPYGGGNQFLLALRGEFERRGFHVESHTLGRTTRACLFNSYNFDGDRLRHLRHGGCRMIHRVDGPISRYRGREDGTDDRIAALNRDLADATVFQSHYSLDAHRALGFELRAPVVIMNAVDPSIFFPNLQRAPIGRKIRLISTSWSSNPNKGAATYQWLDQNLNWDRYEYTFVGQVSVTLKNVRMIPPVSSSRLASFLRQHDIYITASLHDPCSNALLEALACGLPAIYAQSGGHSEMVGGAGFGFSSPEVIPGLLDRVIEEYTHRRDRIAIPTLADVADRYLSVMGLA